MLLGTKLFSKRPFLDGTCLIKSPSKSAAFFFYGVFFAMSINMWGVAQNHSFIQNYAFKKRVDENRRAQDVFALLRHKIDLSSSGRFSNSQD